MQERPAAELVAFIDGFDSRMAIRYSLYRVTGRQGSPLIMCTDSRSLFGLAISLSSTNEKRLLIDLALLRKAYETRDISSIPLNPADDLTKPGKRSGSLSRLLETNYFSPPDESWAKCIPTKESPVCYVTSVHWTSNGLVM